MTNILPSADAETVSFEPRSSEPRRSREDVANMQADAEIANGPPLGDVEYGAGMSQAEARDMLDPVVAEQLEETRLGDEIAFDGQRQMAQDTLDRNVNTEIVRRGQAAQSFRRSEEKFDEEVGDYGVFPGAVLTFYPDSCGFYQFLPLGTRRSAMQGCGFGLPDERREMRAARYLNRRINNITGTEDIQLIKWSWEGMRSSAFDDFILSDLESGVRAYHDRLRDVLPVLNLAEAPPEGSLAQRNQELGGAV
jgi:hypothetical protein